MTGHCTEQDGLFIKDGDGTKATESDMDKRIQFMSNQRQKHARQESETWWLYLTGGKVIWATTTSDLNQEKYKGMNTDKYKTQ